VPVLGPRLGAFAAPRLLAPHHEEIVMQIFDSIKISTVNTPPALGEGEWHVEFSAPAVNLSCAQAEALGRFLITVSRDPAAMHRDPSSEPDPTFCEAPV
jgi:hypothetical protein